MKDQTTSKEIIPWADLIRVVAMVLVVVVHVSGQITNAWGKVPNDQWIIANIYGGIARVCVPLFFMISGYLLLPRSEILRTFYAKRITRVLIPLIVWSLIYLGWFCGTHPNTCTPSLAWNLLLVKGTYYHLWFLYSLLGIYLILPILRLLVKADADRKILWYLIGLWLIFQPIFMMAHRFWNFNIKLNAPLATGFVGFFVLGYLLGEMTLSRIRIILSAVIWILGTLLTILGTYLFTREAGQFDGFFYDFISINVTFASAAAFILLRWIAERKLLVFSNVQTIIRVLAVSTFGIYLIHVMVIELLGWIPRVPINSFMGNAIWSIPLVSTGVFLLSFVVVRIFQKIPILKYILP
jgi:surface polysaccharide O-acyltransferase-like enzyme